MINNNIAPKEFDPITYEIERQQVFERSLKSEQFSLNYQDFPTDDFASGQWDGLQGFQPEASQWQSADYRRGYHSGIDKQFSKLLAD